MSIRFVYGADGLRRERIEEGGRVNYLLDGLAVLCEFDDSGEVLREYIPGVSVCLGSESFYYHYDRLGSVRFMTDASGSIVQEYVYDAFGNLLSSSGSLNQVYEYVGREGYYREEFDLYLLDVRWYDSEAGRFISRDPIGEKGGINLYEYVGNRPIIYKDGLGLFGFCDLCNLLPGKWGTICEWLCPPPYLNNYEACSLVLSIKIGDELICWYKCEQSGNVERVQKHDPCNKEKCSNRVFRYLDTGEIIDYSKSNKYWERPR